MNHPIKVYYRLEGEAIKDHRAIPYVDAAVDEYRENGDNVVLNVATDNVVAAIRLGIAQEKYPCDLFELYYDDALGIQHGPFLINRFAVDQPFDPHKPPYANYFDYFQVACAEEILKHVSRRIHEEKKGAITGWKDSIQSQMAD